MPEVSRAAVRIMNGPGTAEVTQLLHRWRSGEREAFDELVPVVYAELHRLARAQLHRDRNPSIQPTELVAEAYMHLVDVDSVDWQCRAHFYSMAARTMRRVLVERFRRRAAARRGGDRTLLTFEDNAPGDVRTLDLDRLEDALVELETLDRRQAEIVTLRFFGGLKGEEIGEVLSISPSTVKREWAAARLWLFRSISDS